MVHYKIKIVFITIGLYCTFSLIHHQIMLNQRKITTLIQPSNSASNMRNHRLVNRSFYDHKLWYEEKLLMMNTGDLPLSKFDIKTTKKILLWSETWPGLPK